MWYLDNRIYTESEIKALYPNTSFAIPFNPTDIGYEVVFTTPKPECGEYEIAYQDGTEIDSKGNRVIKWSIKDMFSDYTNEEGIVVTKEEQLVAYNEMKAKDEIKKQLAEYHSYLDKTDYKMLNNYVVKEDEDIVAIIAKRNEYREFIRANE